MEKILVIEDSADNRDLFIESLEAEGFYAVGAENGLVGLQRAQDGLPDLVICDIMMPQLDGYGVLSRLRQDPATAIIPFIFLTAKVTKAEIRQGMEMGADDYLTKPCTVEELLGAIAACLEKRANLRKLYAKQSQPVAEAPEAEITKLAAPKSIFPSDPH
ncbi:MAG: response regulator, partial [Coleofasciculus sp. Co-bin14]|nr:response regulator [Coleofasciculus sp. Co-bin14]